MKLRALFIPTANAGITYWRMFNFWKAASRLGIAEFHVLWWNKKLTEVHPWERDILKSEYMWRITKEIQDWAQISDVIVFGMLHGSGIKTDRMTKDDYITESMGIFRALKDMFNKPIFSEIDDNMLSTPDYNPAAPHYVPNAELRDLAITQFKESDGLIVSTPYLKEVYSDCNENIHVIPNSIDFKLWDKVVKKDKKGIRVGWAGGANHEEDLRMLETIIPLFPKVTFVMVHGCPHYLRKFKNVEYRAKWTHIDKYPNYLGGLGFDIGIAPLIDSSFNRGKSNLRWLEYSALKVPTVASRVGHFIDSIKDGEDGFLASSTDEFIKKLETLIKLPGIRNEMGKNAYNKVFSNFNVDETVKDYISVLSQKVEQSEKEKTLVLQ